MRLALIGWCLLVLMASAGAGAAQTLRPYEREDWPVPATELDRLVLAGLKQAGLESAPPASDEIFLRRVYLDVIGTLPRPSEVTRFLEDTSPDKRAALIDTLLQRDEFADYWTLKWGDLLRVKSEFPINLWPNAVQAYHQWIHDQVRRNRPYDQFARELLTTSGSNFRQPAVNFYRAVQGRAPTDLAAVAALTFMGTRLATWPEERRAQLAACFSRVAYKSTGEWKEEIVYPDLSATEPLPLIFPDGTQAVVPPGEDPREAFADWLTRPDNPWFARAIANRVWSWLLGRGIIHEPDDIRPDNPPTQPELLAYLERELVRSGFDLQHLFRLILNSRTYQQSCLPRRDHPEAERLFAHYPVRRLPAEVLADALAWIGGRAETYSSPVPEPFTYLPEDQRAIALPDGSITSTFLMRFGRPARDTGLESERNNQPSDAQQLYLLNSSEVQRLLERSPQLRALLAGGEDRSAVIRGTYLLLLSRYPTPADETTAVAYWATAGRGPLAGAVDLAWALLNSAEFQYRH